VSRPALGPTQPPEQWVPGVLSPGLKRGRGVTLVPWSRMSRSYTSLPPSAFMACRGTALALYIICLQYDYFSGTRHTLTRGNTVLMLLLVSLPCPLAVESPLSTFLRTDRRSFIGLVLYNQAMTDSFHMLLNTPLSVIIQWIISILFSSLNHLFLPSKTHSNER
jgi:hypothetical protein